MSGAEPLIALSAAGAGRWACEADGRYWNMLGPWGGWTIGAMLAAALSEGEARGTPVAQTAHFLSGFQEGPVVLRTKLVRGGRSLQFWQVDLMQGDDGNVVAESLVTLANRPNSEEFVEIEAPSAPKPEELPAWVRPEGPAMGPRFFRMWDTRPVVGRGGPQEDGDTQTILWARAGEPRAMDYIQAAMLCDLFAPRIFLKPGPRRPATTISMNIYFHATPNVLAAVGEDYVLAEARARRIAGGVCDQEARLWRRDGTLIATSEQLCWFRPGQE